MSKNLNQVPTAAASILATDKMYIARSPFGVTDDRYILGSSLITQFAEPLTTKGDIFTFSTIAARLAVGTIDGQILQVNSAAAVGLSWSTPAYPSASGSAGKILISDGTNNIYSTPTYPNTGGTAGSIVISEGTNKINSTSLWPNTIGTNLHFLRSDGTSNVYSTVAYPDASVTAGKFIISDGTNYIASTSIMPNTVGSAGTIIRSNGTINTYSTSTFADTYLINTLLFAGSANTIAGATLTSILDTVMGSAQGNVLYRNAANWTVLAPGTSGQFLQTGGAAANVSWASGNSGTVTSFSAGTLSPLFTTSVANSTTTPALSFILTNAGANTYFGNATGGSAAPSYTSAAALTKTDDTNVTLTLGGAPSTALLTAASLTLGWTGQLSLARGGTNASLTASNGGIFYSTGSAGAILSGTATASQMLQSGSTAAPTWSTTTWPAASTAGQLLYSSFNNTIAGLSTTARSVLGSSSTSVPNWLALTDGQIVIGSTAGAPAAASLSAGTNITITPSSNGISIAAVGAGVVPAALTKTDDTNVTLTLGGTPSTALLQAASLTLGWTGTLAVGRGGTGSATVVSAPAATAWAGWDANKNLSANSFIAGYRTTATAAGTTTLVVGDAYQQYFTGSTTQTVVMPVTSTLVLGQQYFINNLSSGVVTVQSSGANTIQAMATNSTLTLTCILTSGTGTSSWNAEYVLDTALTTPISLTNGGTNASLTASNGGIFYSTASAGAILAGTATAGQMLQSGASITPAWSTATFPATAGTSGNVLMSNGTNWSSSAPAPAATSVIVDDTTTNATMYPTWVTANTGSLPIKVSSTKLSYNPSTSLLTNIGPIGQVTQMQSSAGVPALTFTYTSSAVNYINVANTITNVAPVISAVGTDSNITIQIASKGTGGVTIQGTSTNDSAAAGYVGEYISSSVLNASAVSITTDTAKNVTTISLTAGDWMVASSVYTKPAGTTVVSYVYGSIATTSATLPTGGAENNTGVINIPSPAGNSGTVTAGPMRISVNTTTTVYLVCQAGFSVSTCSAYGFIGARRVR